MSFLAAKTCQALIQKDYLNKIKLGGQGCIMFVCAWLRGCVFGGKQCTAKNNTKEKSDGDGISCFECVSSGGKTHIRHVHSGFVCNKLFSLIKAHMQKKG